jgi:uncharacterized SAM-binding protein YcdF (DUF218 family)
VRLLKFVLLLVALIAVYPLSLAFSIWQQSHEDEVHGADAIVVLGAAQYDGRPSPVLQARLDQAAYLFTEDLSDTIIVTGGKRAGDRFTEAQAAERYLIDAGVPADRILLEEEGTTTWESLQKVRTIAEDNGVESALFVSDPLHSERVERMAEDLGFTGVYTSYASYERLDRSRSTKVRELVRETASLMVYELLKR